MVTMFISGEYSFCRKAYRVVVLPEPVGPVIKIRPFGLIISASIISKRYFSIPSYSNFTLMDFGSNIRITIDSPYVPGIREVRILISVSPSEILKRPS